MRASVEQLEVHHKAHAFTYQRITERNKSASQNVNSEVGNAPLHILFPSSYFRQAYVSQG